MALSLPVGARAPCLPYRARFRTLSASTTWPWCPVPCSLQPCSSLRNRALCPWCQPSPIPSSCYPVCRPTCPMRLLSPLAAMTSMNLRVPERAMVPRLDSSCSRDMPMPESLWGRKTQRSAWGGAGRSAHTGRTNTVVPVLRSG